MAQQVDQRGQDILLKFEPDGRLPTGIAAATGNVDELDAIVEENSKAAEAVDSYKEVCLQPGLRLCTLFNMRLVPLSRLMS